MLDTQKARRKAAGVAYRKAFVKATADYDQAVDVALTDYRSAIRRAHGTMSLEVVEARDGAYLAAAVAQNEEISAAAAAYREAIGD